MSMKRWLWMPAMAAVMMWNVTISSFAGWEKIPMGWTYRDDKTGELVGTGWQWIDGNGDGVSENYYFADGILLTGTKTPDGSIVDNTGARIENGIVVVKSSGRSKKNTEEVNVEESVREFCAKNQYELDRLVSGAQAEGHIFVLTEMEKPSYTTMMEKLPREGVCYPSANGYGIQLNGNYLYYGMLVDGKAQGDGTVYNVKMGSAPTGRQKTTAERYGYHKGLFADNAANGDGEDVIYFHDTTRTVTFRGFYKNWYQHGLMTCIYEMKGSTATFQYDIYEKQTPIQQYRVLNGAKVGVTAYAQEARNTSVFAAMNGSAQSAAHIILDDNVTKNILYFNK